LATHAPAARQGGLLDGALRFLNTNWRALVVPLSVLGITVGLGLVLKRILFKQLGRWAGRTTSVLDNLLVDAIRAPFMLWVLMLGLYLATATSQLPTRIVGLAGKTLLVLWIISVTIAVSSLAADIVRIYASRVPGAAPATTLTGNLAKLAVVSVGTLLLLNVLGISITPILTALGVGGLAVALALQDTLSNLFSGFYISVANQIRVGDYIKLSTGEEGYVTDISWRSTSIRTLPNNIVFVPNAKLAQAIVTNYHLPERRMSVLIPIGVSYDSDPEAIERLLVEEAVEGARDIPGLLAEPAPFVRFIPGFGDSSLNFTLICQVQEFVDQYLVQHELRKRIFKRFREEGVEIPFPIRTVYFRGSDGVRATPFKTGTAHAS
jgi:small-conductance mechanosensitive channel